MGITKIREDVEWGYSDSMLSRSTGWIMKIAGKSLRLTNRNLARQWDIKRNEITPDDISKDSRVKVWWRCSKVKSHVWFCSVKSRTQGNDPGCPLCQKKSLKDACPELVAEWHKTKNGSLNPANVMPASDELVFWKCPVNRKHAYEMSVNKRVYMRVGCPYCANMRVLPEVNSLQATNPSIAKQWHEELNKEVKPDQVVAGSAAKAWWICSESAEHVWQAQIFSRTVLGSGCPYCTNRKVDKTNCLLAVAPEIAAEWHPSLNGELTAEKVTKGSDKRVWWQCKNKPSHVWQAQIFRRSQGYGICPDCYPRTKLSDLTKQAVATSSK